MGKAGVVVSIADTGAAVSVMPIGHAKQLGVKINTSKVPQLRAANGKLIKSVGVAKLYVKIAPCPTYTEVEFTVTTQGGDILVGNSDLKSMGIISADFPSWKEAPKIPIGKEGDSINTVTLNNTPTEVSSSADASAGSVSSTADPASSTADPASSTADSDASSHTREQSQATGTNPDIGTPPQKILEVHLEGSDLAEVEATMAF